ncbi:uncharacterized protein EV422DRAFT_617337 [Fimicolochytrium jonesii]|uniref:uncharacterized protein n=1 Tax=Fimicolochytrium jonesii TaxID=1396493 RepID=UPI0022FE7854|nr:uncharacterized protein EV422DRAFT_617337 [Fimicolochytrium jonesii]KAI8824877.1 hypothetical protein EV422DRAFT_617337 [Fimicolochytrium jonesii]
MRLLTTLVVPLLLSASSALAYPGMAAAPGEVNPHDGKSMPAGIFDPKPAFPPLPANYESLSALEKQSILWERLKQTTNQSQGWNSGIESAWLMTTLPWNPPFQRKSDEMVPGRKKFIRNRGAHAQIQFTPLPSAHNYTGIFATGGTGLIRLTTLDEPPKNPKADDVLIAPGGVVKFLISGRESTNLFVIYSLEGQKGSWNYFENALSNHLAPPTTLKTKAAKLLNQRVSHWSEMTGLSGLASVTPDGKAVENPKAPFQLWLVPTDQARNNAPKLTAATASTTFATSFSALPPSTPLYHIYAIPEPIQPYNPSTQYHATELSSAEHLGDITTTSEFIASTYGDAQLHFKHTSFDEDLKLRPLWEDVVKSART